MKNLIAVLTMAVALSAFAGPKGTKGGDNKGLEEAVQTVATQINEGFNKGDAKQVAAAFADDAKLINPAGVEGTGRAEIEKVVQHDLDTMLKGAQSTMTVDSVRKVGNDAVFADLTHACTNMHKPDGTVGSGKAHVTTLMVKHGGKWQVAEARAFVFVTPPPNAPNAMTAPTTGPAKTVAGH
jgi:uncharacterized protein (TIGR02246 family)